jgi:purine-nucleoside phosphorylase
VREPAAEAAAYIRTRTPAAPTTGIILGSGLGGLADRIREPTAIPYADIPGFPQSEVPGHANQLVLGQLGGRMVAAMQGRVHLYEGYSAAEVAFPVRVLHALGARILIVSNAAGGLNPDFQAGDIMLIRDHIFLPGMAGHNPLSGSSFVNMSDAYDEVLQMAARQSQPLREGVYVMVAGPSYETPAECRALRAVGADAVGMSTCPEVVVARQLGLRVLGLSLITNVLTGAPTTHQEVLATADAAAQRFCDLVEALAGDPALAD